MMKCVKDANTFVVRFPQNSYYWFGVRYENYKYHKDDKLFIRKKKSDEKHKKVGKTKQQTLKTTQQLK